MMQEVTNLPVIGQHANHLPVSEEDDNFLHDNNRLNETHSDVQRMIDYAMLKHERYHEGTVGQNYLKHYSDSS